MVLQERFLFGRPRFQPLTRLLWLIRRQVVLEGHLQIGEALELVLAGRCEPVLRRRLYVAVFTEHFVFERVR